MNAPESKNYLGTLDTERGLLTSKESNDDVYTTKENFTSNEKKIKTKTSSSNIGKDKDNDELNSSNNNNTNKGGFFSFIHNRHSSKASSKTNNKKDYIILSDNAKTSHKNSLSNSINNSSINKDNTSKQKSIDIISNSNYDSSKYNTNNINNTSNSNDNTNVILLNKHNKQKSLISMDEAVNTNIKSPVKCNFNIKKKNSQHIPISEPFYKNELNNFSNVSSLQTLNSAVANKSSKNTGQSSIFQLQNKLSSKVQNKPSEISINYNNNNNQHSETSDKTTPFKLSRRFLKSRTNVFNIDTINNQSFKKTKSNEFDDMEVELEKQRKQKIKELWTRFRHITIGLIRFRKLSRSIRLFGNAEEIFDENNPEVFENKLKIIAIKNKEEENKNNIMDESTKENLTWCGKFKLKCSIWFSPMSPSSNFNFYWNCYLMILMFYTVIFMPYFIAFIDEEYTSWKILENIVDFSFLFDVILTFNIAYYDTSIKENELIFDRKKIAFNYLKGWFFLDLTSSIPFSILLEGNLKITNSILKFTKLPKIYRLVKVLRMVKMAKFFKNMNLYKKLINYLNINWGMSELFYFLLSTIIFSHLFGCLWYLLPQLYDDENNWVIKFELQDEETFRKYLFSLYYSFTTLFTVGFGDIHSVNDLERILSICWMLFGVGFYSFTIGTLSSVLADMDSRENKLKYKLSILNDFSKEANLSIPLKEKIKKILVYNSGKHSFSWNEKQNMFNELPITLKNEVSLV